MSITTRSRKSANETAASPTITEDELEVEKTPTIQTETTKTTVYALTPALVSNKPIDYGSAPGAKIYKQATGKLKTEYYLKVGKIHFLEQLEDRATAMGWTTICEIPDEDGVPRSLFTQFGQLTEKALEEHAAE